MLEKVGSAILVLAVILLVLQEEFLSEKIPYTFFYSCKLLLKTLSARSSFGERRNFTDFVVLFSACFGKKLLFDLAFYDIYLDKYFKYIMILMCIDYALLMLSKRGFKAGSFIKNEPLKTFLTLGSGISDSIGLENLLYRNAVGLGAWHLPVVFLYVILDPILYVITVCLLKQQKKEKYYPLCKKGLGFGTFLTLGHFLGSRDNYTKIIKMRKQIPFNSSNVVTPAVGIRLLNCVFYVGLLVYDLVKAAIPETPLMIKDNIVKVKPTRKESDETAVSVSELDDSFSVKDHALYIERSKSD